MRRILFILLTAVALSATAQRSEQYLSHNWQFSRDGVEWQTVSIPHDWAIAGPFDKKWDLQTVAIKENGEDVATEHSGRSGSLPWIGTGIYKTTFTVPAGKKAELLFDGAMSEPVVFINGREAGRWAYGYNAFRIDATPFIHRDGTPNELEVRLTNLEESSRWYPGAGLYRPVTLITTGDVAFDTWGTCLRTLDVKSDGTATVSIDTKVNGVKAGGKYSVSFSIPVSANNGSDMRHWELLGKDKVAADGTSHFEVKIPQAKLWSPENPFLYQVKVNLVDDKSKQVVDSKTYKLGVRTVSFTPENGFQLNGVTRKIKGVCLHHDLGPLGAAINKAALARQIKIMKDMGADAIRTSHNMPSTWQMELCDSLGMMVMAESFDAWKDPKVKNGYNRFWDEWWQKDISNLIMNHRNHPSIILWSVGNEIPEQWKEEGADRYRALIDLCHQLDPTRMVTCGMDNPDADIKSGFALQADVPGYNYRTHRYEATFPLLPQGFLLGSETASTVSSRGEYMFPDTVAVGHAYDNGQCSGYDLEHCWWSNLPDDDWRLQDDFPWTVGEFVWTGFDYLGEPTPYDAYWPSRSSYYGIVDLAGIPKDRYYLYRSHWNKKDHTLHLLPHWTWPGREGQVTPVYCYTDYPSAELFVNGKSQGRLFKDKTSRLDRYRLRWRDVVYEPGEIKVVAYDDLGNMAEETTIRTAGAPADLKLEADRDNYRGNDDIAFITISLVDEDGNLIPDGDDSIEIATSNNCELVGLCNGDATSLESFKGKQMKLFHGQLVAAVKLNVSGLEERTREGGAMWLRDRITVTALDRKLGKMKIFDFLAN
ncbi:MAG: DUF4982 domain-containing protein [Muribaculaceae bacterium]|nr:DUF4982 domain-containing protein [Muribaculaceae bacterium]